MTRRGRLKIFFGACPGVGRRSAMLAAAQARGGDIFETRGELDLDAALARCPALILLDDLAHENAAGARHRQRWQDAVELLDAGIDVYATADVLHLESLNDVIARITGVVVSPTLPDSVFDGAFAVELVDIPPDELLERIRDGRAAGPCEAVPEAIFRPGSLIALRELALRRMADRVDADMRDYRRDCGVATVWPTAERLVVCVGPSPFSARLIRSARRMAAGLDAEWHAVTIETPVQANLPESDRLRVAEHLALASRLGARTATLGGEDVAAELLAYARAHNVTKIIIGKPTHPRWRDVLRGSLLDVIVRGSGDIDVHVIRGEHDEPRAQKAALRSRGPRSSWGYAWGLASVGVATLLGWRFVPRNDLTNLSMVYLLDIVAIAARFGQGPAIFVSLLSVAAFDFFFVPPYLTFAIDDLKYLFTFGIMLFVGLVVSNLTARIRHQAEAARARERRTTTLYELGRTLAREREVSTIAAAAAERVRAVFDLPARVLLPDASGRLVAPAVPDVSFPLGETDLDAARWAFAHGQLAGRGTATLPTAEGTYLPLTGSRGTVGVLSVRPLDASMLVDPSRRHHLETFADQTALAVERARIAEEAHEARLAMERERLQSSLLSSVSHDLRTPLAAIMGAATTLLDESMELSSEARRDLALAAYEEAERLNRLVRNLLDMTRLESGKLLVNKEWQPLEEVIGSALGRLDERLEGRTVTTRLAVDLPLVPIDGVVFEQVFLNLLENALKYTPPGTPIDIAAAHEGPFVVVEVMDRGPGLAAGDLEHVFEKFYRATLTGKGGGAGLGLAICRGIVGAHGGQIEALGRGGGGAVFRFTIPLEGTPPTIVEPSPGASL